MITSRHLPFCIRADWHIVLYYVAALELCKFMLVAVNESVLRGRLL